MRPWSEEQVERGIASGIERLEYRIGGKMTTPHAFTSEGVKEALGEGRPLLVIS